MTTVTDMVFLEMLSYPFVQRAFIAGLLLAVLLASLGIFVTLRKMAFFGDGLAHSSLAGIAIALLLGLAPLPVALMWALVVALAIYLIERSTRLPSDTLIGIFFTASMALGVVLMSFTKGYQPELITYLFGSILGVRQSDLMLIVAAAAPIMAWLIASFRELTYLSLAEENAHVAGVPVAFHTLALYAALAVAIVLGVKILGIVLVSAFLVLPPATSRMLTSSFRGYLAAAIALSLLMTVLGLSASFLYDLPSGATIILTGAAMFFLAAISKRVANAGRKA
jgi:zinc transport system permease protein